MKKILSVPAKGAEAGTLATLCMTPVMLPSKGATGRGSIPPEKIVKEALKASGARKPGGPQLAVITAIAHLAFGAAGGAAFAVLHTKRTFRYVPATAFGLGIWYLAYRKVLPRLGLMPHTEDDRPGRVRSNIAAHIVYGAVLGATLRHLDQQESEVEPQ